MQVRGVPEVMHGALALDDELGGVTSSGVVYSLGEQPYLLKKDDRALSTEVLQGGVVIDLVAQDLPL